MFTDGLHVLFEREADIEVVGVMDLPQAGHGAARLSADIIVTDLLIQALDGPALIAQICKQAPKAKIIVLSISVNSLYASQVMSAGAWAYVLKAASFADLMRAVRAVARGSRYLSPDLDARAIGEHERKTGKGQVDRFNRLTTRERQVLQLAAQGRTSTQIAASLGIGRRTAETHRANIYKKLGVESQTDLITLAVRHGLLEI